jgi:ADP-ribose pyrophosphatase YjhB (NUDIX family)/GNAT superfamily N-acetyltransferase
VKIGIRRASGADGPTLDELFRLALDEQLQYRPSRLTEHPRLESPADLISDYERHSATPGTLVLIGVIDEIPVGYCVATLRPAPASPDVPIEDSPAIPMEDSPGSTCLVEVEQIFVREEARGVGVGSLLIAAAACWAKSMGATKCEMTVLPGHRAAKNFCEQHGLKARAITMAGAVDAVLDSVDLDEEERAEVLEAVSAAPVADAPRRGRLDPSVLEEIEEGAALETEPVLEPADIAVAAGCVVVKDGAVLLHKRVEPPFQGHWSIPGGHPRKGETLAECAVRELREETGLDIELVGLAGVAERVWETDFPASHHGETVDKETVDDSRVKAGAAGRRSVPRRYLVCNFLGIPKPDSAVVQEPSSKQGMGWFSLDDLPSPLVPGVGEFLSGIKERIAPSRSPKDTGACWSALPGYSALI